MVEGKVKLFVEIAAQKLISNMEFAERYHIDTSDRRAKIPDYASAIQYYLDLFIKNNEFVSKDEYIRNSLDQIHPLQDRWAMIGENRRIKYISSWFSELAYGSYVEYQSEEYGRVVLGNESGGADSDVGPDYYFSPYRHKRYLRTYMEWALGPNLDLFLKD